MGNAKKKEDEIKVSYHKQKTTTICGVQELLVPYRLWTIPAIANDHDIVILEIIYWVNFPLVPIQ